MAKQTVQGLILEKLNDLDKKIDLIATQTIPKILTDVAVNNQQIKDEARMTSRLHSMLWGGLTLLVSLTGVAVAYFRH
jgi:hypothetical protein